MQLQFNINMLSFCIEYLLNINSILTKKSICHLPKPWMDGVALNIVQNLKFLGVLYGIRRLVISQ